MCEMSAGLDESVYLMIILVIAIDCIKKNRRFDMAMQYWGSVLFAPRELHIPDGFLSPGVYFLCWVLALVAVGLALRRTGKD